MFTIRGMDERYFALIGIRSELAAARNRVLELEELELRYTTAPASIVAAPMVVPERPRISDATRAKMAAAAKKRWAARRSRAKKS